MREAEDTCLVLNCIINLLEIDTSPEGKVWPVLLQPLLKHMYTENGGL